MQGWAYTQSEVMQGWADTQSEVMLRGGPTFNPSYVE